MAITMIPTPPIHCIGDARPRGPAQTVDAGQNGGSRGGETGYRLEHRIRVAYAKPQERQRAEGRQRRPSKRRENEGLPCVQSLAQHPPTARDNSMPIMPVRSAEKTKACQSAFFWATSTIAGMSMAVARPTYRNPRTFKTGLREIKYQSSRKTLCRSADPRIAAPTLVLTPFCRFSNGFGARSPEDDGDDHPGLGQQKACLTPPIELVLPFWNRLAKLIGICARARYAGTARETANFLALFRIS